MKTFSTEHLEEVINARSRFTMLAYLTSAGRTDFLTLVDQLEISSGNLSQHIAKLEEAGYITTERVIVDRRPKTLVELTKIGETAFHGYVNAMREMVKSVPAVAQGKAKSKS